MAHRVLNPFQGPAPLSFSTIDATGNITVTSLSLVKDSLAPALTISAPASNTILGSTTAASILSGNCEAGLTVTLEGSDVPVGQTTTCPSGSYSFAAGGWSVTSGDGTKTPVVSQTDAAGNKGTANVAVVLNTDLPPPANFSAVSIVNGPKYSFTGTCDSSASFALTSVASNIGNVASFSCVANVLRANVSALPSGINTLTLTATMTRISNGLTRVTTANFNQQFFCPQGYVGVPGKFATDSDTAGL